MPNCEVNICINKEKVRTLVKKTTWLSRKTFKYGSYMATSAHRSILVAYHLQWCILCMWHQLYTCKQQHCKEEIGMSCTIPVLAAEAMESHDLIINIFACNTYYLLPMFFLSCEFLNFLKHFLVFLFTHNFVLQLSSPHVNAYNHWILTQLHIITTIISSHVWLH